MSESKSAPTMSGDEHYELAARLLAVGDTVDALPQAMFRLAKAQVHATLAVAAALRPDPAAGDVTYLDGTN